MFVEQRTYTLKPGKVPEFLRIYQAEGLEIQLSILGRLVGYYSSEIGTLNQLVHLWAYEDLADRAARRARLAAHPGWQSYLSKVLPLIDLMESKILLPAPFSPVS